MKLVFVVFFVPQLPINNFTHITFAGETMTIDAFFQIGVECYNAILNIRTFV